MSSSTVAMSSSAKIRWLERKARKSNKNALFELACIFEEGDDEVKPDPFRAVNLYEKAAQQGHTAAICNLALLFHRGAPGVRRDPVRAIALYKDAIANGSTNALNNLANLLREGAPGVERDPVRAKEHYEAAIANGNTQALVGLADLLKNGGFGVKRDPVRTKELYENAIANGNTHATIGLANLLQKGAPGVERDPVRAKELYETAIAIGNTEAKVGLANLLKNGAPGVERDPVRAKAFCEDAIIIGDTYATYLLARLLEKGAPGLERDPVRAKSLYEDSIKTGNTNASIGLARMLENGAPGVKKDPVRAIALYENAIASGNHYAINFLANLLTEGAPGVDLDPVRAKSMYERAIESGDTHGSIGLANLLTDGVPGVEQDLVQAKGIYEDAIANGNTIAANNLAGLLIAGGPGVKRDPLRAKALFEDAITDGVMYGKRGLAVLFSIGAGSGVDRDVKRSKILYEQILEEGGLRLKAITMSDYGHLLMFGYGEGQDLSRAMVLLRKCVEDDVVQGMIGLGLLLWKGGDDIEKDPTQSKRLFENVLKHPKNWKNFNYDLGSSFHFLFEGSDLDHVHIRSDLYIVTRRPAKHFAHLFLGFILMQDVKNDGEDISCGTLLLEAFLQEEHDDDIIQFVKEVQTSLQEQRLVRCALQNTYADVVRHPTKLTENMIISMLKTENVSSMDEIIAGHNILCLARKGGVLTDEDIDGTTDVGWHVQRKFYLAASRLRDANNDLLEFIFHDAQVKGIIRNGIQFVIANELTSDMEVAARQINNAFQTISKLFLNIDDNISTTFNYVLTLSKDLNKLHDLFKFKNRVDKHVALASCLLSLIPIIGKSIGESARIAAEFFIGLDIEDGLSVAASATEYQLSNLYSVDLSDFRTGLYIFSENGVLNDIDKGARLAIQQAIENSQFNSLTELQQAFLQQIRESQHEGEYGQEKLLADSSENEKLEKHGIPDVKDESYNDAEESVVATYEDNYFSFERIPYKVSAANGQIDTNQNSDNLISENENFNISRVVKSGVATSSIQLVPFLKKLALFGEMIMENEKLTRKTTLKLLSTFLFDLEKEGIISDKKKEDLNVAELIAQNDQDRNNMMELHEMEATIKSILQHFIH